MQRKLYEVLKANREEVLGLFVSRVMGDEIAPAPAGARRSELIDHLPGFFDEMIVALEQSASEETARAGQLKSAADHGVTRLRQGFDVEALVREYGIMRECILTVIERAGASVTARDFGLLSYCLDVGTIEAVKAYVGEQQQSLASAALAREDVLAVVSHDLRNPLNTVVIAIHKLASLVSEESQQYKLTQTIQRSADRMLRMIGDLLDASSIQAGQLSVERDMVDAVDLLSDVRESFESACGDRGLALRVAGTPGIVVVGDRQRLHQVLANLVGNAVKFTPRGGAIDVNVTAAPTQIEFEVRDTGDGIPEDQCASIFDRFWKGQRASRTGTGLGLYIARGIVEAHGGKITVTSVVGQGTSFRFWLPRT